MCGDHGSDYSVDLFQVVWQHGLDLPTWLRTAGGLVTVDRKANPGSDLKVFISNRDSRCEECGEDLRRRAWITLVDEGRALCLSCADLEHLVFLPADDTALTRRARKRSRQPAVILKWSRARKRYERQGLLVEEDALEQAEWECAADAANREARRARAADSVTAAAPVTSSRRTPALTTGLGPFVANGPRFELAPLSLLNTCRTARPAAPARSSRVRPSCRPSLRGC